MFQVDLILTTSIFVLTSVLGHKVPEQMRTILAKAQRRKEKQKHKNLSFASWRLCEKYFYYS
jgi:hypothetical protein